MSGNVASIVGSIPVPANEPIPDIVRLLEELLERAKSGEIASFGAVTVTSGNMVGTCYAPFSCRWRSLSAAPMRQSVLDA